MEEVRSMFSYCSERKQTAMLGTAYAGWPLGTESNSQLLASKNSGTLVLQSQGIEFCQ